MFDQPPNTIENFTEFEATFPNIDKEQLRATLEEVGAVLIRPEFMMTRVAYHLPSGHQKPNIWARVRDEGDKITMSVKMIAGPGIDGQKEALVQVDSFDQAEIILLTLGCTRKSLQQNLREIWELDGVAICIDTWPFLPPFVEVEGPNEADVKKISEALGFSYTNAQFCAVDTLYSQTYGIPTMVVNIIPAITFDGPDPFNSSYPDEV